MFHIIEKRIKDIILASNLQNFFLDILLPPSEQLISLIFAVRNFIDLSTLLNMKPNVKKMKQSSATQLWKMFKLGSSN